MNTVQPVILSGGSGTRLWPLSREAYPKQFLPLAGELTMLQATWRRLAGMQAERRIGAMGVRGVQDGERASTGIVRRDDGVAPFRGGRGPAEDPRGGDQSLVVQQNGQIFPKQKLNL